MIRDEAHRFAITAHRRKRGKLKTSFTLETIEDIGPKRRRDLLRYFGGLQGRPTGQCNGYNASSGDQ